MAVSTKGRRRGGSEPFAAVLERVEAAKRELLTAVPSPRGIPARQLAEALLAFEERLREAGDLMSGWQDPASEAVRSACAGAVREALRRAERLRLEGPALDYEGLVAVLDDLIEPLEAFAEAELSGSS